MKLKRLLPLLQVITALVISLNLFAQEVTVQGTITDSKTSAPLSGATVRVKNGKASAVTDANGNFKIVAPSSESIISVTYVGYQVYEVKAGAGNLSIALISTGTDLNEVVVVGYSTQKKVHLTGAVETFNPKDIEDLPVSNIGVALTSRVLGLGVSGGTTRPGSPSTLTIRNPVVLSKDGGTTSPLFVIDGVVQYNSQGVPDATLFNNLDPSEIESITVLKDGSAAIYGSRSANGVVLVTTKRGKSGKPRISYSGSVAVNDESYRTKMLSAYEYGMYYNIRNGKYGANMVSNSTPQSYFFSDDELEHYKTINYDKLSPVWEPNMTMRQTLNVSGGSDRATYFAGFSYYDQNGNLSTLDYKKYTFRAGADVGIANGFKIGLQLAGNYSNLAKTFNKIGGEVEENDYRTLLLSPKNIPYYVEGMPIMLNGWNTGNVSAYNFYEIQNLNNQAETKNRYFNMNMYAEYDAPFLKGLKARFSYNKSFGFEKGSQIGSIYYLYKLTGAGTYNHIYDEGTIINSPQRVKNGDRLYYSNENSENSQTNFSLSYNKRIKFHEFSAFVAVEKAESEAARENVLKETPNSTTNGQFASATGVIDGTTTRSESGSLGYLGRLNYAFSDRYLAEFLFRTDASTRFAPENYWGKFYSASVGWVVSNEKFFSKVKGINFLKVRYSFGKLGKDDTKAWQWRQRYTYQFDKGIVIGNNSVTTGMKMEASPNRNATWSDEYKNNLGFDLKFLRSRLSSTIEVFYNKSLNMLMNRTGAVPVTVGGSLAAENWGKYDFFGYELGIGWRDVVGKDFNYGIDFRFGWSDNKIIQSNFGATDHLYPWKSQPGKSSDIGQWGYDYLGMFKTQADIDAYVQQYSITSVFGTNASQLKPGMLYYRDVRGPLQNDGKFAAPDGKIDDNDQILLAKKENNHYGFGMNFKLGYKGISLDFVIGGSFGGWSEMDARTPMNQKIENNYYSVPSYWANIYDPELNPGGKYPNPHWSSISLSPTSNFWRVSSFRMAMRNINLSYSLPKVITEKLKISNARVILSVLNPVYLYNPYDYRAPDGGWDTYPNLRTYSAGLNVTL